MKKVFLSLMAVAAIALTGCKPEGQEQPPSSNPSIIGTWTCEYEGEYGEVTDETNIIKQVLVIEEGGAMTFSLYAYGEELTMPTKWFVEGGQFCYIDYGELYPEDEDPDTTRLDYKVTENTLEFSDGDVTVYKRVK